jgi:DMSO/TMAO reductase YedYZ molybdopterin-dependent catalytic subunit
MRCWNENFESLMFSPSRLAPELPASEQTAEKDFPIFFHSPSIPVAPSNWSLKVSGLIKHPMSLTLDQLQRMPATEMRVRLYCVNGWTAVASWRGVRFSEVARLAGPDPRVKYVEFRSFDSGYWSGWDLASAMHPQTLLAYGMNGHPLEAERGAYGMNGHPLEAERGAPLRLYSAIKLGFKSVKYLSEVIFLPNKTGRYCEEPGWEFAGV